MNSRTRTDDGWITPPPRIQYSGPSQYRQQTRPYSHGHALKWNMKSRQGCATLEVEKEKEQKMKSMPSAAARRGMDCRRNMNEAWQWTPPRIQYSKYWTQTCSH